MTMSWVEQVEQPADEQDEGMNDTEIDDNNNLEEEEKKVVAIEFTEQKLILKMMKCYWFLMIRYTRRR